MTQKYEVLLLTVPEITGDESKNLESQLEKIINSHKGSVVSFDRWGKYKLAYEVKGNEYGVYYLLRFDVPNGTTIIDDIRMLFKVRLNAIVMRDVVVALDPTKPLTYQRPRSLEEAPAREGESFKNGMYADDKSLMDI